MSPDAAAIAAEALHVVDLIVGIGGLGLVAYIAADLLGLLDD